MSSPIREVTHSELVTCVAVQLPISGYLLSCQVLFLLLC
uniref:Uncharacterized protein n=1 Tax=Arundo donax TaxID=35708 RepID=A0A0A9BWA1_ARUDO